MHGRGPSNINCSSIVFMARFPNQSPVNYVHTNLSYQTGGSNARMRRGSSRVGFLPSQVKPPTDVPVDLTKESFDAVEDVQTFTLQASQLAVVVASYDKTIGKTKWFRYCSINVSGHLRQIFNCPTKTTCRCDAGKTLNLFYARATHVTGVSAGIM